MVAVQIQVEDCTSLRCVITLLINLQMADKYCSVKDAGRVKPSASHIRPGPAGAVWCRRWGAA
jgi:hypothetical protein